MSKKLLETDSARRTKTQKNKEKRKAKRDKLFQKAKESRKVFIEKCMKVLKVDSLPKVLKFSRKKMGALLEEKK